MALPPDLLREISREAMLELPIYRYEGEATADTFTARYTSKYDHGEFRLSRKS